MSIVPVQPKSHKEMIRQYPISDKVEGWYFRVQEVSQGSFLVEGRDAYGRQVSRTWASDPD